MGTFLISVFKLISPWFTEWWKSRNMDTSSVKALREIHVMFIMHLVLFAFFLFSVEHGVGVYVAHTKAMSQYSHSRQTVEELRRQNEYLAENYTRLLNMLEEYAENVPKGTRKPLSVPAIEHMREGLRKNEQQ